MLITTICVKKKFCHTYRVSRLHKWLEIWCGDWLIIVVVPFGSIQELITSQHHGGSKSRTNIMMPKSHINITMFRNNHD